MKGISYRIMPPKKSSNYLSEDVQEKKKQKYKLEKYEKFMPKKKESSINDNESILKGAESQVKQLLSLFLKNIEKEEKENQGDPLFLNAIEKTKKNKHLSYKSFNNSIIKGGLFRKKSTGNDEKNKKLDSLKVIKNLNYNTIKFLKSNSFNNSHNPKKNNRDINNNNDICPKLTFNKEHKENNTRKKNKNKFNSNKAINDVFNGIENKNSRKRLKDIKRKSACVRNSFPEKKYSLLSEDLIKKKNLSNLKIINVNNQKKDKGYEKNIDLNESIILNKFTSDLKEISKHSSLTNNIRKKDSSDYQSLSKHLRNSKDIIFPKRTKTSNLCVSCPKLLIKKETSNSDNSKITANYKSDEEIKNKNRNIKNIFNNDLNSNVSFLSNKTSNLNKKNIIFKRCQTNFIKIFGGNVNKKELFRANTIFKSLRKQLKKTVIFRPEDLNLSELDNNYEKSTTKINKKISKRSLDRNNQKLSSCKLNENNSVKLSNIKVFQFENNEEKKINNKISLKNVVNKNELENSIIDLNISKQKLLIVKNKNKIYQIPQNDEKYRKLAHKGEVYDSLDDDEEDEIIEPNNFYINPNSIFCILFDGIKLFLSMYSAFHFPLYLAFTINFCKNLKSFNLSSIMDILVEIFYIIDFFIGFFKAYYNFDEQLIKKRTLILKHYIKTWSIIELLEAIPVYTIIKINHHHCSYINYYKNDYGEILNNMNYLFVYNKLFKFYKILYSNEEISILFNKLNNPYFTEYCTLFMKIFAIFSVFHASTCMYIFIGRNSYQSWLYYTKANNKSFFDIYVCSFYFLLTSLTTVGYGDIISNSIKERIFQIFLLMIGIIVYSWIISSFSNYVRKLNKKNVKYEKDIEVLNDIKLNNALLPDSLYDKIKRHLKYKQYFDKKDKNIIFDCLPIGLKNILIYEMYKPIIKNFIFFKNFENTDFIVKVILAFRPIIAIKNDILVNEGDMVEDLMFVKKGILSVELPINLKNPQKNIHEYLYGDILSIQQGQNYSKIENSTILEKLGNSSISNITQTYFLDNGKINNTNLKTSVIVPGLAIKTRQDMILELQEKEKERTVNTRYLRILKIRENEHFGDVLMFLEKRSPLRVRVVSKKTELFFLRKMDVVSISLNYQNIWKRINKKSVYNFEQIKKSIRKIIELYCSIKGYPFDRSDFEDSSNDSKETDKNEKPKKRKKKNKLRYKRLNSLKIADINKIKLYEKYNLINKNLFNEYIHKRTKSINNCNIPIIYNLKNYYQYDSFNSNNASIKTNSQLSDSMSKSDKIEKQLLKTYNKQYKDYAHQNKNSNKFQSLVSIIKEEPENETTIYQKPSTLKNGFSFKNSTLKNTINNKYNSIETFNKNNEINNQLKIKENVKEIDNNENSDNKKELHSNTIGNLKSISNISEKSDIKKNDFLSRIFSSRNNISNNSSDFENSNISLFDNNSINNELKLNEKIQIPIRQEKPLLNLKHFAKKNTNTAINKNIFMKTKKEKKYQELLNSNISSQNKEKNENDKSKIEISIEEIEKSIEEIEKSSNTFKKNINFNVLKIEKSKINIEIKSSYENINKICNNKYSTNTDLQNKLKIFLIEETNNTIIENNIRKNNSVVKFKTKKRRVNSTFKSDSHSINRLMTYNETSYSPRKKGNKYKTNVDFEYIAQYNTLTDGVKTPKKFLISKKKESIENSGVIGNIQTMSPINFSNRRKKENLLSMINFNIQRTNQKLNNPNEFYSMYFQSIIKNDKRLEYRCKKRNSVSFSRINIDKRTKIKNNKTTKKIN